LDLSNNTALLHLNCSGNQFSSLDASNNAKLWSNEIADLDLGKRKPILIINDMPNLNQVCVPCLPWEGEGCMPIESDEWQNHVDITGSPNVDFKVDCGYNIYVYIPDTAFLYALIDEGVDTNEDSLISYDEAEPIISLDVEWCFIHDMTGIESFANLDTLNCSSNLFTNLDLTDNPALRFLDCGNNSALGAFSKLESLNVSNNEALEILHCGSSQLTSLDVSNNINLHHLDLSVNQLTNLDISNNTQLELLDISYNPSLNEVCVWTTPFPPTGITVHSYESPGVCFETDCNGVCENTEIAESEKSKISVYPIPTKTLLTIETVFLDQYEIEITSLKGQQLLHEEMEGNTHQFDLSSLQKGVYLITVRSKDFVTSR
jgi:hypothetical protein